MLFFALFVVLSVGQPRDLTLKECPYTSKSPDINVNNIFVYDDKDKKSVSFTLVITSNKELTKAGLSFSADSFIMQQYTGHIDIQTVDLIFAIGKEGKIEKGVHTLKIEVPYSQLSTVASYVLTFDISYGDEQLRSCVNVDYRASPSSN
ncbi:hypothetical protein EIN_462270 [Entamoeba invadens IP1]|uniref:MD-2-related lipid-recognition domain-containing protein n=1 Tax=Entamoeba invadens IP1 TaxID=370355 RepID=A0A0A1U9T6_ENTIV|nr:hypothetical protein EIN_461990 [Entamoeba invadens IP1]XP_004256652.1 hypothetical protein EIN_462270 [Entamoeba invadens IP1]ELP89873.1 hypothetical protein EIN_461990 [Entamoeba invadens IP1]ELP89881.1 hypothetical protein EIN_462270 [Entamoeba invadens IP1]|eukprot:XP_004256644.1 hypothetical protein EIN_461990 [Entamoeba invadens IP1]